MSSPMTVRTLFVTRVYETDLAAERGFDAETLADAARAIADEDAAGQAWAVPKKASALKLEDPRLAMMMAAPKRRADAPETDRTFVSLAPAPGTLLLWESFVRHEVPANQARRERVSLSFNYA